jgi:hypothetical protein
MRGFASAVGVAIATFTVLSAWAFVILSAAGVIGTAPEPQEWHVDTNCPQEDSCYPDYRDGEWYIVEGSRD